MKKIILLLLAFIVFGCSPQKRLERLYRKYPYLFKDSIVYKTDTIIKEGIKYDTIKITKPIDSLIIDTNGVNVKIYRVYDTLKVNLKTKTDTIYVKNKIITKYLNTQKDYSYLKWVIMFLLINGILFLIIIIKSK